MTRPATPRLASYIAALNCAPYLDETLRTAEAQAGPDVEVVIVDGGSGDSTSETGAP